MKKSLLIIDPGHGGKDPGGGSNEYFIEKNMALWISKYQYDLCKSLNIPVVLTRDEDEYLYSSQRAEIVRSSGARYCISNHINAGGGEGAETIYSIHQNKALAQTILESIYEEGQKIRRAFSKSLSHSPHLDYYFMHRKTGDVETVIVEYGFADHKEDTNRIVNDWKIYAEAVIRGFCKHIGHTFIKKDEEDGWKYEGIKYLHERGMLKDLEYWNEKVNDTMPVWAITSLLKEVYKQVKGE